MSVLPSPIPHPLDLLPWDVPGWVYQGLEWVLGAEWPEGDERAVWDLADQWFAVASALVGPRDDAFAAASEVLSGYGHTGDVAYAFDQAWRKMAAGDDAPLVVLLMVSHELGTLVEECGCDIEAAKIEVWIQVGILIVELIAMTVAVVLTLGAASPAAAAAMAATRAVVQQIFRRLVAQLARKTLRQGMKEATEKAAKEVAERGVRGFARRAGVDGLTEAGEEVGTDLGTQLYQNSTGRRDGLDVASLGMSAVGGFAGGAGASLAGLGGHASGRAGRFAEHVGREMTGEVLAENAASLATGQGVTLPEDAVRAATSGASSATVGQTAHLLNANLDGRFSALAGPMSGPGPLPGLGPSGLSGPVGPEFGGPAGGVGAGSGSSVPSPPPVSSSGVPSVMDSAPGAATAAAASPGPSADPANPGPANPGPANPGPANPGPANPGPANPGPAGAGPSAGPIVAAAVRVEAPVEVGTTAGAGPATVPATAAPTGTAPSPVAATTTSVASTSAPVVSAAPTTALPVSTAASSAMSSAPSAPSAVSPAAPSIPHQRTANESLGSPPPGDRPSVASPAPGPAADPEPALSSRLAAMRQGLDRRGYRGYAWSQRAQYEQNRRADQAHWQRSLAAEHMGRASSYAAQATRSQQAGDREWARHWQDLADRETRSAYDRQDRAEAVLAGTGLPPRIGVDDPADFHRINDDVGNLADGGVSTGDRSALTGTDHPPPINRSRRYGQRGGLRRPLALHQSDLERQLPRDPDGNVVRTADPRQGRWFRLANDGGPRADPTRSINCLDCVLSFYETWVHGRPRVAAPRTFDGYANGNIYRPLDGEADGPGRVEDLTGGRFQQLCPDVRQLPPAAAQQAVQGAYANLQQQLLAGGHGSYAFVVSAWEGGASHAWVAVNQSGTILYLDPQSGRISAQTPLYGHRGAAAPGNVVALDALVLDHNAEPMPLRGRPPGLFSAGTPLAPTVGADDDASVNRMHLLDAPAPGPGVDVPGSDAPLDGPSDDAGRTQSELAPFPPPSGSLPPAEMMRDPSPADLRELGVGLATFADLGLDPETLSPEERARYGAALSRTALIAPDAIRFTQRSVSPQTSDGTSAQDLVGNMRDGGWRGGPVHGVRWGDGSVSSLDNRRLRAARRAGLDVVPFVVHGPSDRLADWPQEWSPARQRRAALGVDIIELADGSWVAGGAEGRTVYAKGTVPQTFGDIALFRAAEQRSLLPGHLFGADREPVLLGRPPDPTRPVQLREADQRILDDLRLRAEAAAGQVQHDLAEVGQAVTAALGLGETIDLYGQEHRVKGAESLARKYADEGRSEGIPAAEFAHQINDVLRFSLVLPPGEDYRPAVDRVLAELRQLDYQIDPESVKNFWGVGNRFYGLNCTLTSPDGQTFELQLPTEASRRVGKLTHEPYEILRRKNELAPRRVHAFLRMLEINKRYGMTGAIPPDLDAAFGVKDATFAKWILGESTVWRDYRAWLDLNGRSFAEIVAEFGLVVADFPVSARVAAELEDADVGLLRALPDGREDDPVRDLRDGPRRARVDLGSLGQGVVVQPVAGGADRGRLPELRPLPDSGSGDGGADRASGDRRGAGSGRGVDQLGVPVGGQPTPERRLTDAEAQAESRPDRKAIPEPRLRDGREQAHEHRLDPRLPVEAVVATAPRLAAVFAAGVTPAEAAGQLDQTNLRRLVPRLGEAEAGDIARFLADSRVQQMLDNAWRTPPRAEPMLAEKLLGQLTERVGLVRMIQETPTLANSLTARPLTLHHLASQQEAIDVLASVLDDIATQGAAAVAAEPMSRPEPTRLQAWQVAVSASIEVPEEDDLQPGFDQRKKDDPIYRAAYLNRLYADAEPAQRELMALARRLSNEGQPGGGKPGWRKKLKDRARAEDKIAGYQGLADRLRDIAGAKIEFQNLGDLYAALDRLRLDPTVTIVQFSDRFREPQRSGYRDIQLMLRTSNGHIAEFRLHQAALDEVAVWEHALFEVRRDIEAIAEQEGRAMTATERAIRDGVMREEQSQFWQALRSTIPEVR